MPTPRSGPWMILTSSEERPALFLKIPPTNSSLAWARSGNCRSRQDSRSFRCPLPYREWMERALADLGLTVSTITLDFTERQIGLQPHHRDPFDRLLVAQCLVESIPLVSADSVFDTYGIARVWA